MPEQNGQTADSSQNGSSGVAASNATTQRASRCYCEYFMQWRYGPQTLPTGEVVNILTGKCLNCGREA